MQREKPHDSRRRVARRPNTRPQTAVPPPRAERRQSELTGGADDGPRASCLCVCVPKGASAKLSRFSTNVAEAEGLETFEDGAPKRGFVQNMFGAPFTMLNRTKPAYDVAFTLVGYPHDNVSATPSVDGIPNFVRASDTDSDADSDDESMLTLEYEVPRVE